MSLGVTGGTSPFTYLWSTGATTQNLSGIQKGTYNVVVTDNTGCKGATSAAVTEPDALQIDYVLTQVGCYGGATGIINITVSGGTPAYTYNWGSGVTTEDRSGIVAGTYAVTVTDHNSCQVSASYTITQPAAALAAGTVVTDVSCNGSSDGVVNLTVTGGTSPYTYAWTKVGSGFTASTEDISGLAAGTYNVTVTDAKGCTKTSSGIVGQPAILSLSETHTNVSCNGGSNGSINLTVSGGTSAYHYSWSNGASIEDPSGLSAGTYTVTVTDAHGCFASTSMEITEKAALLASASATAALCNGGATGSVDLTVSGGTTTYGYLWSNSTITEDLNNVDAGFYSVTVTDAKGCTAVASATVTEPAVIAISAAVTNLDCHGINSGAINVTASGGYGTLHYAWADGPTTDDRNGLAAGIYTLTVTDDHSCTSSATYSLTQPSAINLSMLNSDISCHGGNDGAINLSVSGGVGPYSYVWSNSATTEDINGLTAGNYTVTVTDANHCTATLASEPILQPDELTVGMTLVKNVTCKNGSDGSATATPSGGTSAYTYLWSNGSTLQTPANFAAGSYSVVITDAKGCTASGSIGIGEPPTEIELFATTTSASACGGSTGSIDLTVVNGTAPFAYAWTGPATIGDIQDPGGLPAGTYTVVVTDNLAC